MRRLSSRNSLLGSAMGLVLALGAAISVGFQEPSGPKQTLPDGTVLELIGASFPAQSFPIASPWSRAWNYARGRVFPFEAEFERIFSPGTFSFRRPKGSRGPQTFSLRVLRTTAVADCSEKALAVWFRIHRNSAGRERPLDYLLAHAKVYDNKGDLYPHAVSGEPVVLESEALERHSNERLDVLFLEAYPRRERQFQLTIAGLRQGNPPISFEVRNPAPE